MIENYYLQITKLQILPDEKTKIHGRFFQIRALGKLLNVSFFSFFLSNRRINKKKLIC